LDTVGDPLIDGCYLYLIPAMGDCKTETPDVVAKSEEPVQKEVVKPEAKEETTTPVKKEIPLNAFEFCKAVRERFPDAEPSENAFTGWLGEIYGVGCFKDLGLGRKWRKFLQFNGIDWKNGKVTYPSEEDIQRKLKKQCEFYFSDGNLPKDDFLLEIINKESNPEKWVDLTVILTFKLVQKWCDNVADLAKALSKSEEIEVSECKTKIRRVKELTLTAKDLEERTTQLSGMSVGYTLTDLKEFLSSHGGILAIFNRRLRPPKTMVDIIWATKEAAEKFAESKNITYKNNECKIVLKAREERQAKQTEEEAIETRAKHIMRVKNLPENTDWKNFKEWMIEKELDIKFIKLDGTEAIVRMAESVASTGVEKLNGQTYNEKVLEVSEIPKEEAKAVVESLKPDNSKRRRNDGGGRGGNRKKRSFNKRNNRGGGRKRKNSDEWGGDGGSAASKKQKVEEN